MRILIADDDSTARKKLEFLLSRFGWQVMAVSDGEQAWARLTEDAAPKLALLDISMPKMTGIEICREARQRYWEVPPYLILLTAKGNNEDIILGLDAGAHDYLVKPFNSGELRARVDVGRHTIELQQSLVERIKELEEALTRVSHLQVLLRHDTNVYEFGPFELEAAECRLLRKGTVVPLAAQVFDLLLFLVQNSGHLITKEELMARVWRDRVVEDNNLTVAISALRKALEEDSSERYIETVPRRGYRFVAAKTVRPIAPGRADTANHTKNQGQKENC